MPLILINMDGCSWWPDELPKRFNAYLSYVPSVAKRIVCFGQAKDHRRRKILEQYKGRV